METPAWFIPVVVAVILSVAHLLLAAYIFRVSDAYKERKAMRRILSHMAVRAGVPPEEIAEILKQEGL